LVRNTFEVPIQKLSDSRILITGASGWLGRETLCWLNRNLAGFRTENLTLAGSSEKIIEIHGRYFPIRNFYELDLKANYDLIIHYAFLTQDKMGSVGSKKYYLENTKINNRIREVLENNHSSLFFAVSSGAVPYCNREQDHSPSMQAYAKLKKDMENIFTEQSSLILRLWSASGHHMGVNLSYALSEFLYKAQSNVDIEIRQNVHRTYISFQDVFESCISALYQGRRGIVNSGGFQIDLASLAQLIVESIGSRSKVTVTAGEPSTMDQYVSPECELVGTIGRPPKSIQDQIIDMVRFGS
jgi:nucleoside-diphosphate-sugar epimerase